MKRWMILAAALMLSVPTIAMARDDHHGGGGQPQVHQNGRAGGGQHFTPNRGGQFNRTPGNRGTNRSFNRPGFNRPQFNGNRAVGGRGNFGNRAAGHSFQFHGRSFTAVHLGAFHYPRGWGYRRWSVGNYLPLFFLSAPYFFDYGDIGLPPPPPGTYWVRYGPDALLVDRYSGRIVNVIPGVFY